MSELQEAYMSMQNACGIKKGDTVKVLYAAETRVMGWQNSWTSEMDNNIGKELVVYEVDGYGLNLEGLGYPFFVLQKIKSGVENIKISDEYEAIIQEDAGIKVGCQKVSFDKIEEIYIACKKNQRLSLR